MDEHDLSVVDLGLGEVHDALVGGLLQGDHAGGGHVHLVHQLVQGRVRVHGPQHAGRDLGLLPHQHLDDAHRGERLVQGRSDSTMWEIFEGKYFLFTFFTF